MIEETTAKQLYTELGNAASHMHHVGSKALEENDMVTAGFALAVAQWLEYKRRDYALAVGSARIDGAPSEPEAPKKRRGRSRKTDTNPSPPPSGSAQERTPSMFNGDANE